MGQNVKDQNKTEQEGIMKAQDKTRNNKNESK